ncbi:hypothetical protein CF335_g9482, partial [Tilletia laevis]
MKMLNNTALILLVLVLVLAVQASPVPRSPHTSSTEPGVDEPHDQAGVKSFSKALSDRTSKRNVTGPVGGPSDSTLTFRTVTGLISQNLPKGPHIPGYGHSGASPKKERRSDVAAATPTADTHRDPVQNETVDRISSASMIALKSRHHKQAEISLVKRGKWNGKALGWGIFFAVDGTMAVVGLAVKRWIDVGGYEEVQTEDKKGGQKAQ